MDEMTRVSRPKATARATYNRLSRWYDPVAGIWEQPSRRRGLHLLNLQPGERVLEIGFGTGHALVAMAAEVEEAGHCFGLDLAPGMARVAIERIAEAGFGARVGLCLADGAHPPFARGVFDAIFISFTLELFDTPEIPVVLHACRAMLQPKGRLCVVALSRAEVNLAVRIYEWAHHQAPSWVDCRPIYLRPLLRDAGYRIVGERSHHLWGVPVDIVLAKKDPLD
jgi:ubiquinone/menaquinone biosynthesis C-methylase UbiE